MRMFILVNLALLVAVWMVTTIILGHQSRLLDLFFLGAAFGPAFLFLGCFFRNSTMSGNGEH